MNCYEWAANFNLKFSTAANINYSWGDPSFIYTTIAASGEASNPDNKPADQLTRKELVCKQPQISNALLRKGIGCLDRWQIAGSIEANYQIPATITQTINYLENGNPVSQTSTWAGFYNTYFSIFREITYENGTKHYVQIIDWLTVIEPWDSSDPFYKIGHKYWERETYKIQLSGGFSFLPNENPDPNLDPIEPPISSLSTFAEGFFDFKLGTIDFDIMSYEVPLSEGQVNIGTGTFIYTVE